MGKSVQFHANPPDAVPAPYEGGWTGFSGEVPRLNVNTKDAIRAIGSSRLFKRLRHHRWIRPLCSSRDVLYPWAQILAAQLRMEKGDMPPLLPSENMERADRQRKRTMLRPIPPCYEAGKVSPGLSA
jgi:hypothetical protein